MSSPRDTHSGSPVVANDYQGLRSSPVSPPLPTDHIHKYSPPYIQSASTSNRPAVVDINRNSLGGGTVSASSGVLSQDGVRGKNNTSPTNPQSSSPLCRSISPSSVDYRYNISTANTFRKHLSGGAVPTPSGYHTSPSSMSLSWVSRPGDIPTYINERAALLNSLNIAAAEGTGAAVRDLISSSHPLPSNSRIMSPHDMNPTQNKHVPPPPSWGMKENHGTSNDSASSLGGFVGNSSSPDNDAIKMARFCMLQQPLNIQNIQSIPSYYLCNHDSPVAAAAAVAAAASGPLHISPSGSLSRSPHTDYMNPTGQLHTGGFIPPAPVSYSYGKMPQTDTSQLSPTLSQGRSSGFIPPLPLVSQGSGIITGPARVRSSSTSQINPHPAPNLLQVRTDLGNGADSLRLSSSYPTAVAQLSRPSSLDSSHGLLMVTTRSQSPPPPNLQQSISDRDISVSLSQSQRMARITPSPDPNVESRPINVKRNPDFEPCDDENAESERNDDSPEPSKNSDCKIAENIPSNLLNQIHRKMEKPSKCPYCILAYSCSSSLNRHIKMKHPEHYHGVERKKSKRQSINGGLDNGDGCKPSLSEGGVIQKPNEAAQSMLQSLGLSTPLAEVVNTPPGPQFDPLIIQTSFFPLQQQSPESTTVDNTTTTITTTTTTTTTSSSSTTEFNQETKKTTTTTQQQSISGESTTDDNNTSTSNNNNNNNNNKNMPASLNSTLEDSLREAMKPIAASSSLSSADNDVIGQNVKDSKQTPGLISCRLCGTSFHNKRQYRRHLKSKSHQISLKESNTYLKSRKRKLKEKHRHDRSKWLNLLNPVNNPHCELCNREFTCDATYQVHIESKEHIAIEEARRAAKIQEQRPKYTCELCNLVFNNRSERAQHYRSEGHRKLKQAQEFAIRAVKLLPPNPGLIERPASVTSTNSTASGGVDANNSDADSDASTKCGNSSDTLTAASDDDVSSQDTGLSLAFSGTSSSGLSTPSSLKRSSESDEESELKKLKQSLFQDGHDFKRHHRLNGFHHHQHECAPRTDGNSDVPLVILPGRNIPAKVALNVVEELVDYFQQLKGDEAHPGLFAGLSV